MKYKEFPISSYKVYISDPSAAATAAMMDFINEAKLDLITIDAVDVSDVSPTADEIYEFIFGSEQDAVMFTLRWKK